MSEDQDKGVVSLPRLHHDLYGIDSSAGSLLQRIAKAETMTEDQRSNQSEPTGTVPLPFDFKVMDSISTYSPHHSACLHAKANAHVGLGHMTPAKRKEIMARKMGEPQEPATGDELSKVDTVLNPLCKSTWQETQMDASLDYWNVANAYLEIVKRGDTITGIHHLPAKSVRIHVEDAAKNFHYVITDCGYSNVGTGHTERRFAQWGDKADFINRMRSQGAGMLSEEKLADPDLVSEVIHIRQPTPLSKWYGYPDWVAAVADIELGQMLMQHNFDFYLNRGVPEFILFLLGQKLPKDDWDQIKTLMEAHVGLGNSRKSLVSNLQVSEDFRVELFKLAMEDSGNDTQFAAMRENIASAIVSAHRVPPLLAGIQIPGKLGATNELPNALQLFQLLVMSPAQRLWQQTLGSTLGNAGLGLTMEDFRYVKLVEEVDLGSMDTVARMRQSPAQAASEGRDLGDGVKD